MVSKNRVKLTAEFTPAQITEALIAHFKLPPTATIRYEIKYEYENDRMGGGSSPAFKHAKATFHKDLTDVL